MSAGDGREARLPGSGEGYTDVLDGRTSWTAQVVATMGTANDRHVRQLRRFVARVVLVFDADAGGEQGVDRALELFAGHDMDLAVATLPAGLDPCDLLVREGPEAFRRVLEAAEDALEFKLARMVTTEDVQSVEGRRRILDAVLRVIALAPSLPGEAGAVKTELMMTRIARRLAVREETVWGRLEELRRERRQGDAGRTRTEGPVQSAAPALPDERRLLEILLAEPELVPAAAAAVPVAEVGHPGLRRLLDGLYALHAAGRPATLDLLRIHLEDNAPLVNKAFQLQEAGLERPNRQVELTDLVAHFRQRREKFATQELRTQLHAVRDDRAALELLRRLQNRTVGPGPDAPAGEDCGGHPPVSSPV
ncbi:MAG: toprim domain-containing protein [Gemmataceae bacterium]